MKLRSMQHPLCMLTTATHWTDWLYINIVSINSCCVLLIFFPFFRKCHCDHPLFASVALCFITFGAPGCCNCQCVAMETETHFWSRWVFWRFLFWQFSLLCSSMALVSWMRWAVTSSGVIVMNLPPPPAVCVCIWENELKSGAEPITIHLSVLRCWTVSLCPVSWSRKHLWESRRHPTSGKLEYF